MTHMTEKELLEFPCLFPLKIMGLADPEVEVRIAEVVKKHDPTFDVHSITKRQSNKGRYLALNVVITASSREQLDALYMELTHHPMVKVVL